MKTIGALALAAAGLVTVTGSLETPVVGDLFEVLPEDWLRRESELLLTDEERAQIESMGGFDALMQALKERLEEQEDRHEGGSKWIGTAGTSPFGAYGYNPEGVRMGQDGSRNRRAVKVWDKREYRNLDDSLELGTRNIKVALRRLRKFAREGAADQLDLDDTIDKTARNAGLLDIRMVPERHNAIKVLLCLDIGGSMAMAAIRSAALTPHSAAPQQGRQAPSPEHRRQQPTSMVTAG